MDADKASLGLVLRNKQILIVNNDLRYKHHYLVHPTNGLMFEGVKVELIAIIKGEDAGRRKAVTQFNKEENQNFTNEQLLEWMEADKIEFRVFTTTDVHVFQFIRGEKHYGKLEGIHMTTFWDGCTTNRDLFLKYAGRTGKCLQSAFWDEDLAKAFPFIHVLKF